MCFSAIASFTGGVIICSIGILTIKKVHSPSQIVFASIPFFFGLQQITEGFVWLSLQHWKFEGIRNLSAYTFLVMADVFWPIITPLAMLLMEKKPKRIKSLQILFTMGLVVSFYNVYCLNTFSVAPAIAGKHIDYNVAFPELLRLPAFGIYVISSVAPLFISSIKGTRIMGALMAVSCLITIVFYTQYLTSVWCFFAAAISIVIYWMVKAQRKIHFVENEV